MSKLKGKQKNLDANKDGKISGEDFAMLRAKKEPKEMMKMGGMSKKKKSVKKRGMGLQDEQLPPGKMVKAKSGAMMSDGVAEKGIGMEKKMGGGMVDPTMANYQKGGSVMARGSKLAKVRPTKLY